MTTLIYSNDSTKPRTLRKNFGIVQNDYIGPVPATHKMPAIEKRTVRVNGEAGLGSLVGDVWYKVSNVPVQGLSGVHTGWVAFRHKGQDLCVLEGEDLPDSSSPLTPPPVSEVPQIRPSGVTASYVEDDNGATNFRVEVWEPNNVPVIVYVNGEIWHKK